MDHGQRIRVDELRNLRERFGETYRAGDTIFRQGDPGSDLFVVVEGLIEFAVESTASGQRRVLRSVGPGELFGEMSCFSGEPRSATANAVQDTLVLRLSREAATELVNARPDFAMRVINTLAGRLRAQLDGPV